MNRLQEVKKILQGRLEWSDHLPAPLQVRSEAELAAGVLHQGKVWRSLGGAQREFYFCYLPGALSDTELQLVRLLLTQSNGNTMAKRALWEEKIEQALHEPLQAFAGPVRIEDELETIAVPWTWPVFVVGLRLADRQAPEQTRDVRRYLETLADPSDITPYVTVDDSLILAIFSTSGQDKESDFGEETARATVDGLMTETFLDARAVWSKTLHSFPEMLRTVKRMLFVAHTAEALTPERKVVSDQGLGVFEMLYATRTQFRQAYADHILPPSALLALGADLEQTVMTFVSCDLNMSETSRHLYLHRNSLLYRIDRIRELTGFDIRRFADAVTVWTALLLKRL